MSNADRIAAARAARAASAPPITTSAPAPMPAPVPGAGFDPRFVQQPAAPAGAPPWQGHQPPFASAPTIASPVQPRPHNPDDPLGQLVMTGPDVQVRVISAPGVLPTPRGGAARTVAPSGSFKVRGNGAVPLGAGAPETSQGSFRVVGDPGARNSPVKLTEGDHNASARVRTHGLPAHAAAGFAPQPHPMQPQQSGRVADLTVWLSVHRRPMRLKPQLQALRNQTVQPSRIEAFVNPGGIPFDEATLSTIHTERPSSDKGAYRRFTQASLENTRFVAILDDDCVPGTQWLERAMQRIAQMAAQGIPIIVACAGTIFRADDPNSGTLIGPESPRPEEHDVDLGRGGWIMETRLLEYFSEREGKKIDERGWAYQLAHLVQKLGGLTIVLPYEQKNTATWGMTSVPAFENSISAGLEEIAAAGQGYPVAALNAEMYQAYRALNWTPLCVTAAEAAEPVPMWEPDPPPPTGEVKPWNPEDDLPAPPEAQADPQPEAHEQSA